MRFVNQLENIARSQAPETATFTVNASASTDDANIGNGFNSIHDNKAKGIELASGANNSISVPVLSRSGRTVSGTTCYGCIVDFFTDNENEGRK